MYKFVYLELISEDILAAGTSASSLTSLLSCKSIINLFGVEVKSNCSTAVASLVAVFSSFLSLFSLDSVSSFLEFSNLVFDIDFLLLLFCFVFSVILVI